MPARGQYSSPVNSFGYSVRAYQPYYEPPTSPQSNNITTGSALPMYVPDAHSTPNMGSSVVNRKYRSIGQRFLFSMGGRRIRQFLMTATGAVASSTFQPYTAHTWFGTFNDALYQAGYPGRNLGISEKVPTINPAALGTAPWQQLPRPQYTRSIFTNRSFSVKPGLPAIPQAPTSGQHS